MEEMRRETGHLQLIFHKPFSRGWLKGYWFEKLIAIATLGKYSHVEIRWPGLAGHCFSSAPHGEVQGCRFIFLQDHELEGWDVVDIPCTWEQAKDVRDWCDTQMGKKYDWLGIIGHAIFILAVLFSITAFLVSWLSWGSPWCGLYLGLAISGWAFALWVPGIVSRAGYWYCSGVCSQALHRAGIIHYRKIRHSPNQMYRRTIRHLCSRGADE